jgi:hypothetical protein
MYQSAAARVREEPAQGFFCVYAGGLYPDAHLRYWPRPRGGRGHGVAVFCVD